MIYICRIVYIVNFCNCEYFIFGTQKNFAMESIAMEELYVGIEKIKHEAIQQLETSFPYPSESRISQLK